MSGGDRGIARRYAELADLRATCLPFLPGTATGWSNHSFPRTTAFVVDTKVNDGMMMEYYTLQSPEHAARAAIVYEAIIEAMFS